MNVGIQVRAALTAMICKKSFSMAHITKELTADAVSFVATEVPKVFDGIQDIHYIWTSPFEAAAILLLLWTKVGIWVLPGKRQSPSTASCPRAVLVLCGLQRSFMSCCV